MPITTYARAEDMLRTADPDICKVIATLHLAPFVKEVPLRRASHERGWWHFPRRTRYRLEAGYSVLWPLGDTLLGPEWQIVNFYHDDAGASINTVVTKEVVLAYLYGCATRGDAP